MLGGTTRTVGAAVSDLAQLVTEKVKSTMSKTYKSSMKGL
jgi:hypothetical protein